MRTLALAVVFVTACGDSLHPLADASPPAPDAGSGDDAPPDGPPAPFHFSQPSYDFGYHAANASSPAPVEIWNDSAQPLSVQTSITGPFTANSPSACDQPIAPGGGCTIYIQIAPTMLGPLAGSISATANGVTLHADLRAIADGFIHATATGPGQVTASLASTDCFGCYPGGTSVTLTATADAQAHFIAWSDPACPVGPTCTLTAELAAHDVTARFEFDQHGFEIDFAGDGPGEVAVFQLAHDPIDPIATCAASCSVAVQSDDDITVIAISPVDSLGFGAPCVFDPSDPARTCTLPSSTTSVTVDFETVPGEVDLFPTGTAYPFAVISVDSDAAGDLVLGTLEGVIALSPMFTERWRVPISGTARFATDGSVYVLAADGIYKLDATGHQLWFLPGGEPVSPYPGVGRDFLAMPGGGFVFAHSGTIEVHDGSGAITAQWPGGGGIAVGRDGTVYVPVASSTLGEVLIAAYLPDGTRVPPDFTGNGSDIPEVWGVSMAVSNDSLAVTSEAYDPPDGWLGFGVWGLDRVGRFGSLTAPIGFGEELAPTNVAMDATGNAVWYHPLHVQTGSFSEGMGLRKYTPTGSLAWSVLRTAYELQNQPFGGGLDIYDITTMPDGRVVVGGRYFGFAMPVPTGVVEIFPP